MTEFPEVVSVIPNGIHKLHTTRSWDFIGVHHPSSKTVFTESNLGQGTIIGVIDTGTNPLTNIQSKHLKMKTDLMHSCSQQIGIV